MAREARARKQTIEPLVRPATVRALAALALAVLALTLVVDAVRGHAAHFGFDGIVGFYALLGLAGGFAVIGFAKGLGVPLGRPDTYYRDDEAGADE